MTKMLLEYFETLTVLEPVESLAQGIQNELKDRVIVENGTILKNRLRGKFDWIFLVHVLEHLESPCQELAELARFLAKNGTMVIAVPNGNALSRQIAKEMGLLSDVLEVTRGESLQGHFRTYNSKTLKDEVLESGMDIIESGGVLLKPLANFQLDMALEKEIISISYIEALEKLSETYPDLSSTIYVLARLKNIE
jgi:2-polyprenyl-3-methyl-5-hydroxy-6-metoxy-1,4-benzoquinol methylase